MSGYQKYEASSVEEAVESAQGFKRKGLYDWFRGQMGGGLRTRH
jgi:hypothetical protein